MSIIDIDNYLNVLQNIIKHILSIDNLHAITYQLKVKNKQSESKCPLFVSHDLTLKEKTLFLISDKDKDKDAEP